jgi:hypothetical protein
MSIQERISAMPRAVIWAILSAVAIGVYFLAVEPALVAIDDFNAKAETRLLERDRLTNQLRDRERDLLELAKGERTHGPVSALQPTRFAFVRAEAVIRDAILDLETIESSTVSSSEFGFQDEGLSREFLGANQELVRLVFNFNFTASPEDVIEAIRRFEASADIHSVSAVRLRLAGQDQRQLAAQLTLEAWAIGDRR